MSQTVSSNFDLDQRDDPTLNLRAVGLVSARTGCWVIASLDSDDPDDRYRAYAPDTYSRRVGLICICGPDRASVIRSVREEWQ